MLLGAKLIDVPGLTGGHGQQGLAFQIRGSRIETALGTR